jgi:hypothetical protein
VSTRSRTAAVLLSLLLTPVVLAGCGNDEPAEAGASASATTEPEDTAPPAPATEDETADDGSTEAPTFPGDVSADTAEASADALVTVRDIRTGRHEGFDRVVLEVGGTGTPGWDVRYVDQASAQGSGEPVEVAGDAVLQITLTGAGYPYDTRVEEYARGPVSGSGTEVVTGAFFDGTFEGTTVAFVGTTGRLPFRVYALDGPTRVVLEVAHSG